VAARTTKNYRMVLSEILRFAAQKRYIAPDANPMSELTRNDIKTLEGEADDSTQPAILSPKQAEDLLAAAFKRTDLDLGAAVALGLFCGIRTEELKRLKWEAVRIEEEHPFVIIGPDIAKKRRIRNVPIPECALAWLRVWKRKPGTDGKPAVMVASTQHRDDYQKKFKKLCKEANLTWESNAMRHSFGSYHFALHGNSVETARLLGHKQDDSVLFSHYRALATKKQGEAFFAITPKASGDIIPFSATA
jgi:integrase